MLRNKRKIIELDKELSKLNDKVDMLYRFKNQ